MDIWAWVREAERGLAENGRGRLAELMLRLPGLVCDDRHAEVDALVPEALALAREVESPWIEVFVRHWYLQSRILHRHQVERFLPEAVALIELASRPEARDCPQSVCATQDLVNCYAHADGPGWVPERLAASEETLARINASWPCFSCISSEKAAALVDGGRPEEALRFLDAQETALVQRGDEDDFCGSRVQALMALGRFEEALALNDASKHPGRGQSFELSRAIDRARLLLRSGRAPEAKAALPPFELIAGTHLHYPGWTDAVERLAEAGQMENDWSLEVRLFGIQRELAANGVVRDAFDVARARVRLALARGRRATAARALEAARALVPRLRRPLDAPAQLLELEAALGAPSAGLGFDDETTLPILGEDPEVDLERLEVLRAASPDDETLMVAEARALMALGEERCARERLEPLAARSREAARALAGLLVGAGDREALVAQAEAAVGPELGALGWWAITTFEHRRGDLEAARAAVARVLALDPAATEPRRLFAELAREAGELDVALEELARLTAEGTEPGPADWDRMTVATLLGRWDRVRASAARLELDVPPGEGPIETGGGLCRVKLPGPDGQVLFAERTGPVTATILEIGPPGPPCPYRDQVVFDAAPLNAPPEAGEEEEHTFVFPAVGVLAPGGFASFALEGIRPSAEALEAFEAGLSELGGALQVVSPEDYEVWQSASDAPAPGIYALLAVPAATELSRVAALLDRLAEDQPVCSRARARALGAPARIAEEEALAEELNLA